MLLYRMAMRPTWLLSGQVAGSVVLLPVLFGTTQLGDLEILARYCRVADAVMFTEGNNVNHTDNYQWK